MRSKVSISNHPLHRILVAFPIAFFTGTVFYDILGFIFDDAIFRSAGYHMNLSGLIGGIFAAIPGIIDFVFSLAPNSPKKKLARKHGLLNSVVLILYTISFFYKHSENFFPLLSLAIEITGLIVMVIAVKRGLRNLNV